MEAGFGEPVWSRSGRQRVGRARRRVTRRRVAWRRMVLRRMVRRRVVRRVRRLAVRRRAVQRRAVRRRRRAGVGVRQCAPPSRVGRAMGVPVPMGRPLRSCAKCLYLFGTVQRTHT